MVTPMSDKQALLDRIKYRQDELAAETAARQVAQQQPMDKTDQLLVSLGYDLAAGNALCAEAEARPREEDERRERQQTREAKLDTMPRADVIELPKFFRTWNDDAERHNRQSQGLRRR